MSHWGWVLGRCGVYPVNYTDQIARILKPAYEGDKRYIEKEIQRGVSRVYRAESAPLYLVIRMEGAQMVIVSAAGKHLQHAQAEIIAFAMGQGASSIRFHTIEPKRLAKGMAGLPITLAQRNKRLFKPDEFVFRLEL